MAEKKEGSRVAPRADATHNSGHPCFGTVRFVSGLLLLIVPTLRGTRVQYNTTPGLQDSFLSLLVAIWRFLQIGGSEPDLLGATWAPWFLETPI